jgi:2-hydroxycyclohexanecarboxyl-CoA dehydrogenase
MGRLDGKVAIVTGGGEGIGRGIAIVLAREGAQVALGGRTAAKLDLVVDEIAAAGGTATAVACDVCVRGDVEHLVDETVARFGPPDILVNNAHGNLGPHATDDSGIEHITEATMVDVFRGGVLASLYGMQACFPYMKERGGTIVNMGSRSGIEGIPGRTAYGTAKEAIRGLTKHAAREWGRHRITVNVLCPAAMSAGTAAYRDADPARFETILGSIPLRYMGDPVDDIAPAVVALATDLRYLTGATLMLDGGMCILR